LPESTATKAASYTTPRDTIHGHGLTRIRPEFTSPETFFPLLKKRSDLRLALGSIAAVRQSTEEDVVPLLLRRRMRLWQTRRGASAADSELDM
jgi:hypothetical protein